MVVASWFVTMGCCYLVLEPLLVLAIVLVLALERKAIRQTNRKKKESKKERNKARKKERKKERTNERTNERTKERKKERKKEMMTTEKKKVIQDKNWKESKTMNASSPIFSMDFCYVECIFPHVLHGLLLCGMHLLQISPWTFVMWNASSPIFVHGLLWCGMHLLPFSPGSPPTAICWSCR